MRRGLLLATLAILASRLHSIELETRNNPTAQECHTDTTSLHSVHMKAYATQMRLENNTNGNFELVYIAPVSGKFSSTTEIE